ncbi:MAG: Ig-like domain-containing protein, partial [Candidatus Acidiferrum sp.]
SSYPGDHSFASSSGTYNLMVTPAPTVAVFNNNPVPLVGQPVTMIVVGGPDLKNGVAPTGTVSIFDGSTLIGGPLPVIPDSVQSGFPSDFSSSVQITYSTGGVHQLTAKYSGDPNYAASSSAPLTVQPLYPTTLSVTASPTTITFGQSFTITAVVTSNTKSPAMTGSFSFLGSFTPITGTVIGIPSTDANGNQILTATTTTTPQSSEFVQVNYSGDSNFQANSSSTNLITVNIPDFTLGPGAGITIVTSTGQSASGQITITPATQTPSTVNLAIQSPVTIAGYTISLNSNQVSLNGSAATAMLLLSSTGSSPTTAMTRPLRHTETILVTRGDWWSLSATMGLAAVFLLLFTDRRRRYCAATGLGMLCLLCLALGCGGGAAVGGGAIGGGGGAGGATPTSITLTTSNSKVDQNTVIMLTAQITAQHPLTGMVSLYDYGTQFLGTFSLNGTQAIIGEPGNFYGLGVHQITAQYTGDPLNLASTSSALPQVITGTTSVTILGNTGSDFHSLQATLTLQ